MFLNGSELRGMDNPFVRVIVLINEEDTFRYPIFTNKLPTNEVTIVKHIWAVMNDIWEQSRYRNQQDDSVNEPVKFLITVYAIWAYTKMLQNLDARSTIYSEELTTSLYDDYENAFSAEHILRECETTRRNLMIRISNKRVRAENIFNVILINPCTPFASIARLCVRIYDETLQVFYNLIEDKFQIFPMRFINTKGNFYVVDCKEHQ